MSFVPGWFNRLTQVAKDIHFNPQIQHYQTNSSQQTNQDYKIRTNNQTQTNNSRYHQSLPRNPNDLVIYLREDHNDVVDVDLRMLTYAEVLDEGLNDTNARGVIETESSASPGMSDLCFDHNLNSNYIHSTAKTTADSDFKYPLAIKVGSPLTAEEISNVQDLDEDSALKRTFDEKFQRESKSLQSRRGKVKGKKSYLAKQKFKESSRQHS